MRVEYDRERPEALVSVFSDLSGQGNVESVLPVGHPQRRQSA